MPCGKQFNVPNNSSQMRSKKYKTPKKHHNYFFWLQGIPFLLIFVVQIFFFSFEKVLCYYSHDSFEWLKSEFGAFILQKEEKRHRCVILYQLSPKNLLVKGGLKVKRISHGWRIQFFVCFYSTILKMESTLSRCHVTKNKIYRCSQCDNRQHSRWKMSRNFV